MYVQAVFYFQDGTSNCQQESDCPTQETCLEDGLCGELETVNEHFCQEMCSTESGYEYEKTVFGCGVNEKVYEICEIFAVQKPRAISAVSGQRYR